MSPWMKMGIGLLKKKNPYSANVGNWKKSPDLSKWSFLVQFKKMPQQIGKMWPLENSSLETFSLRELSKCCSLQSLTKSWDSLRGFMHYVETSGFEIASLPHSNSLRFFHFVGIWTNNNRSFKFKSATTMQRLICHSNTQVVPFFR